MCTPTTTHCCHCCGWCGWCGSVWCTCRHHTAVTQLWQGQSRRCHCRNQKRCRGRQQRQGIRCRRRYCSVLRAGRQPTKRVQLGSGAADTDVTPCLPRQPRWRHSVINALCTWPFSAWCRGCTRKQWALQPPVQLRPWSTPRALGIPIAFEAVVVVVVVVAVTDVVSFDSANSVIMQP